MWRRKGERRVFFPTLRRHQIRKKRGYKGKPYIEREWIQNLCNMFVGSVRLRGKEQLIQERDSTPSPHTADELQKRLIGDESLLKMLIFNLQPLEITEDFVDFVKVLSPTLTPPPTSVIHSQLRQFYNRTKEELRAALSSAQHIALTCELWSPRDEDRYLTVGCHFVDSCDNLRSCILQTSGYYRKMPENDIQDELLAIMDAWDIRAKVCAVVMAGVPYAQKVLRDTNCLHMCCFAESLNKVCEDSMKQMKETIERCLDIIRFFKTDSKAMRKLRDIQSQLGKEKLELVMSSGWQWFLVLPMLQSLSQQYQVMLMVLDERGKTTLMLTADDKCNIQKIIAALKPVSEAVSTMKKEGFQTISFVLPMMNQVMVKLEEEEKRKNGVASLLLFKIRYNLLDNQFASATFLDPRLKKQLNGSDIKKACDKVNAELSSQPFSIDGKYEVLLDSYKAYDPPEEITNPVTWWRHTGKQFTELSELALKNLIIVSTVVPLKTAFSYAGWRLAALRGSIKPEDLDMMLFLNSICVASC